jgi:hypothetical protein
VVTEAIAQYGTQDDFIGTLNENSFALFTRAADMKSFTDAITKHFNERVESLYAFNDLQQGRLVLKDGAKNEKPAPVMQFELTTHVETNPLELGV